MRIAQALIASVLVRPAVQVLFVRTLSGVVLAIALVLPPDAGSGQLAGRQVPAAKSMVGLSSCEPTPTRRLRLGLPSDRPPLSSGTAWQPQGVVAAYVRRMPAGTLELHMLPAAQLRQRMQAGRLDAVIGLPLAELPAGWKASPPFLELPLLIATRRDASPVLSTADLHGRTVAILDALPASIDAYGLNLLPPSSAQVALARLRQGTVDAVIGNAVMLEAERRRRPDDGLVISSTTSALDQLVLALAPGCDAWAGTFEAAMQAMPMAMRNALREGLMQPAHGVGANLAAPSGWVIGAAALVFLACVQGVGIVRLRRESRRRRQLARRLQEISDNLPAVVFQADVSDIRALKLVLVAGDALQLFKVTGDGLRERPSRLLDAVPSRHRMRVLMALARAVSTRLPLQLEFPSEGVHGRRWLAMRAWPAGGGLHWSGYWVDITGQQVDQLALARAHAQAQADLGARGQLLVALDEGVREPMNVLRGALSGLHEVPLATTQETSLALLGDAAAMLDALLNEVLGDADSIVSEPPELASHPVDLRTLLDSVRQLLAPVAAAKGLWFRGSTDVALAPCVMVDGVRLRQVLFNLLGNALKFTEQGGVALTVEVDPADGGNDCQRLRISVQDTGVGIAPERQQAVFEPYAQAEASTARRYGGTGLGLGISRRLVQQMGGRLRLHSQPGHGSRVDIEVTLRCCGDNDHVPAPVQLPAPGHIVGNAEPVRVLVAEDHPTQQLLLDNWLRGLGVAPDAATDGIQALRAWRQRRHALLLTDLQMPGMGGRELVALIRNDERENGWQRMPIIGLSADDIGLNAPEFDLVLRKPIARAALHAGLQRLLGDALRPLRARPTPTVVEPLVASDLPTLAELAQRFGSQANAQLLVESLSAAMETDVSALQRALQAEDEAAARERLHRIAGGVGSVGMRALAEELRDLSEVEGPLPSAVLLPVLLRLQRCQVGLQAMVR